jgi:hypothetical protein
MPREETATLQDDIAAQLRAAAIPEPYIDMIMGLIACGETERQNREDARAIDESLEAYDRWAQSAK